MKNLSWVLVALAAVSLAVGTVLAFRHAAFYLAPQGYWRGAMAFLLFSIALRMMEEKR
jgi:hypothetical protein